MNIINQFTSSCKKLCKFVLNILFICSYELSLFRLARWFHTMGADVRIDKEDAFLYFCNVGSLEMAQWLQKIGADINTKNNRAFKLACVFNQSNIAKWLISLDDMMIVNTLCYEPLWFDAYFKFSDYDEKDIYSMWQTINNFDIKDDDIMLHVNDITLHLMAKLNRIKQLQTLNLPYVHYDIVNGQIKNFIIEHNQLKNARKF